MDTEDQHKLYCFDTSAFVALNRTGESVISIPASLWEHLEKMMRQGDLVSHKIVFNEIDSATEHPDFITQWIRGKESFFLDKTPAQILKVPEIIAKFPALINYEMEREQADPWIVALAIEKAREQKLFEKVLPIVISQESYKSPMKIPAVCKHFGILHKSLKEFFGEIGLSATISVR